MLSKTSSVASKCLKNQKIIGALPLDPVGNCRAPNPQLVHAHTQAHELLAFSKAPQMAKNATVKEGN